MKDLFARLAPIAALASSLLSVQPAPAQGTAFTYQGQLNDASGGGAANGFYDMAFALFNALNGGEQMGATLTNLSIGATNGLFTVTLDYGPGIFTGGNLWLDISVRTNGSETFTELSPRQPLTPTPYAVTAGNAASFTGAIADSQLSTNIAKLNASQTFSGAVTFSGQSSTFQGNFAGSGLALTNLQVSSLLGQVSTVATWGADYDQQTNVPANLSASNVVAVAAGYNHSLALKSDGTVVAWGLNTSGQTNVPAGLGGVISIAAGYNHSLALKGNGTVVAWGDNTYGETNVPAGLNNVVAVAGGEDFSAALQNNGTVVAWGIYRTTNIPSSFQGSLTAIAASDASSSTLVGLKNNGTVVAVGTSPPSGLSNVVAVALSGNGGGLALKNNGTIVTWGNMPAPPSTNNVAGIAAGYDFGVAALQGGTVMAWGDNTYGETNVAPGLSNVVAVAAGAYHALALHDSGYAPAQLASLNQINAFTGINIFSNPDSSFAGNFAGTGTGAGLTNLPASSLAGQTATAVAWGANTYGQTNVPATLNGSNLVALAGGYGHSLALKSDGTVVSWGLNGNGQTNVPAGLAGVVAIAAGWYHSLALKSDGTVVAWGYNLYGQTNVPAGLNNVVAVAGGEYTSMALQNNGMVVVWGDSAYTNIPSTFQSNVVAISEFTTYSLALKNNGTVVAWNGTSPPAGLSNVVAVAVTGTGSGVALKNDGTIVTWGTLAAAPSTNNVAGIAAGYDFGIAVMKGGTVMAWGDNSYNLTSFPPSLSGVVAAAAGYSHVLALSGTGVFAPALPAGLGQINVFTGVNSFGNPNNSFAGSGANLTSLNASSLSTGTVPDARLSTNVAFLNASQTFTGANVLSNAGNVLAGAFTGNGASLTNLNPANLSPGAAAINISGNAATATTAANVAGNLADSQLSPNVALLNGTNSFTGTNNFFGVTIAANANNLFSGTFTGGGAGLTNVPAGAIFGGLTINFAVLAPGGTTNTLCFTNGILMAIQ